MPVLNVRRSEGNGSLVVTLVGYVWNRYPYEKYEGQIPVYGYGPEDLMPAEGPESRDVRFKFQPRGGGHYQAAAIDLLGRSVYDRICGLTKGQLSVPDGYALEISDVEWEHAINQLYLESLPRY
jgi:hypothetical protein